MLNEHSNAQKFLASPHYEPNDTTMRPELISRSSLFLDGMSWQHKRFEHFN